MSTCTWNCRALAAALVGALAIGAGYHASAAPVLSNTAAVKDALPSSTVDVRYYRRGGAFFGGLVIGGLLGAVISRPYYYGYPGYGYGYGYGYAYPAYSYPYYPYAYGYPAYSYGGYGGYGYRYGGLGYGRGYVGRGYVAHRLGGHVRHR